MNFQIRRADEDSVDVDDEKFKNAPCIQFKNFTKDSKDLVCTVLEETLGSGVLIYIPSVGVADVFTKLVSGDE